MSAEDHARDVEAERYDLAAFEREAWPARRHRPRPAPPPGVVDLAARVRLRAVTAAAADVAPHVITTERTTA